MKRISERPLATVPVFGVLSVVGDSPRQDYLVYRVLSAHGIGERRG